MKGAILKRIAYPLLVARLLIKPFPKHTVCFNIVSNDTIRTNYPLRMTLKLLVELERGPGRYSTLHAILIWCFS